MAHVLGRATKVDATHETSEIPWDPRMTTLILDAAHFAAEAHADQRRKGAAGRPYINHPLAVARIVAEVTEDAEVIAAALLHDVLEDTDVTAADLQARFGARVAGLVDELTDPPERKALEREARKAAQAAHMTHASPEAQLVKIADQTANLEDLARDLDAMSPGAHAVYRAGATAVVRGCPAGPADLIARFEAAAKAHGVATEGMDQ